MLKEQVVDRQEKQEESMLPPGLRSIQAYLKDVPQRNEQQTELYEELSRLDNALNNLDKVLRPRKGEMGFTKYGTFIVGPAPKKCPICGK